MMDDDSLTEVFHMVRAVIMLIVLAVGFGGGIYFGQKFPNTAAKISIEEEKRFLEAQLAITQKIKAKLEQLSAAESAAKPPGGSGFISSKQAAASPQDVKELRQENDAQEAMLRQRLEKLK
jgi:hypothetical protein